jgi:hypothetical protein
MPESYALMEDLRAAGHAAVISGAGPTVLVLGPAARVDQLSEQSVPRFRTVLTEPGPGASVVPGADFSTTTHHNGANSFGRSASLEAPKK